MKSTGWALTLMMRWRKGAPTSVSCRAQRSNLRRLNREEGLSILVAEPNSTVALQYADRATVLDAGVAVLGGDARALPQRADIQAFYFGEGVASGALVDEVAAALPREG
ncbi:ABC-type phosphate/phosphonate transport system ATPase subunit [Variovorax boronicumulans]|nr:ABC-type phosphate/phosphonate transport system ATPase subunit [Variovorax boronicumulans]